MDFSEQRFRALVENALVGIYVIQGGKVVYANPYLAEIFGYELDDVLGLPTERFIAAEDVAFVQRKTKERLDGKTDRYTHRALRKDGTVFPVEVFSSLVQFNERPAVQGLLLDISQREQRKQLLNELLEIGTDILTETDTPTILQRVCETIESHSPFQAVAVSVFNRPASLDQEDGVTIEHVYIVGVSDAKKSELLRLSDGRDFISNRVIVERGQAIGRCFMITPERYPAIEKKGVGLPQPATDGSWGAYDTLFILLRSGEQFLGRIALAKPRGAKVPLAETLEPLEALANLAALALNNVRQLHVLRRQKQRLHGFYRLGQELSQIDEPDVLLQRVIQHLKTDFAYDFSGIFLVEDGGLVVRAKHSPDAYVDPGCPVGTRFEFSQGIIGQVARQRKPLLVNDVNQNPRYLGTIPTTCSEICVPILFKTDLVGVLNIESTQCDAFNEDDLEVLSVVTAQLGLAYSNLKRYESLKEQAIRDALTGLYNRRFFNEKLLKEFQRAQRYDHALSVLFVDVDDMHAINNDRGHLKGDEVLQAVAQMLRENVRSSDWIFRYGGDEFVALLPETGEEATIVSQRLVRAQERWNEQHTEEGLELHLSVGVSCWQPGSKQTLDEIVQQADLRMFQHKRKR